MADSSPDAAELLARFDLVRGRGAADDGVPVAADGPIIRVDYPHGGFIIAPADTGLRGIQLDALITRQRDHFASRGKQVEWKTYGYDQPDDLPARLVAAGFEPDERETVVIGSVDVLTDLDAEVRGVTIRETTAADDFVAISELHSQVWDADWSWITDDLIARSALGPDRFRVLVAETDGRVVSAAWLVMRPGIEFASLWGGSTLAPYRGRGIYRALVSCRAAIARDAGYSYLQVDASDMSRPILERLGFVAVTGTTPYVWEPPEPQSARDASA